MANPIVQLQVSEQIAPAPLTLQKTGAMISSGGTITSPGSTSLITQPSDLTPLLPTPIQITVATYVGGNVQITVAGTPFADVGDTINLTVAGMVPAGYNGTFASTILSSNSFEYPLPTSPGTATTLGTVINAEANSLLQRVTTFFAQGAAQSVSILEVGPGTATEGVNFLSSWITINPNVFYSYLVPRFWDGNAALIALAKSLTSLSAKTYFWITTTLANYTLYAGIKSVVWLIEAPVMGAWPANALTAISWSGGVVTATTTTAHGVQVGQWFQIAGVSPSGYNGFAKAITGTTGSTLVWSLATNPGAETALGTLVASFFASAGISSNEFSLAAPFRTTLNYAPSSSNKVTPLNFAFEFGVTAFPAKGNQALVTTLLAAGGNIISTGAAGGISSTLLRGGKYADGTQFKAYYSIDNVQINLAQALTAALINGANNPQNPLDYNDFGINTLLDAAVGVMTTANSAALVLNQVNPTKLSAAALAQALDVGTYNNTTLVNADPFASYTAENPNDYAAGIYNGISVDFTPQIDFDSITINVNVSNFAAG
jgi:hypothetical protein